MNNVSVFNGQSTLTKHSDYAENMSTLLHKVMSYMFLSMEIKHCMSEYVILLHIAGWTSL